MRDYKNIKAWQRAKKLTPETYRLTKKFPPEELYGVTSQIRRASVSILTNIAEGASRQHKKDYLNFLYVARGSLAELECLLDLSVELGYLSQQDTEQSSLLCGETAQSLYGLIRSVEAEL